MSTAAAALWASIVRTVTPIVVGFVVTLVTGWGVALDDQFGPQLTLLVSAAISAVYYIVVRLLETYVAPKIGWLLLLPKAPQDYSSRHRA